jgi:hypothetical protein
MKLAIKIFLIVLVLGGIGWAIYSFVGGMGEKAPDEEIETTKFEEHISDRVESEIKDKSYQSASDAYDDVMAEISDIASTTTKKGGDEERSISKSEETNSRKMAYYAYTPIFLDNAQKFFRQRSWDESELKKLKERAKELLATKLSDSNSKNRPKLEEVVTYVDGYFSAKSLINSANSCTSVSVARNMPDQVRKYQKQPYTFNDFLSSGLSSAPSKAKSSCAQYIKNKCMGLRYTNYRTSNAMQADADRYEALVREYESAFGRTGEFDYAIQTMLNALNEGYRYLDSY